MIVHCTKCGNKTLIKKNFCSSCGSPLRRHSKLKSINWSKYVKFIKDIRGNKFLIFWLVVLPISTIMFYALIAAFYDIENIRIRGKGGSFLKLLYEIGGLPLVSIFAWSTITFIQYIFYYKK